MLAITDDHTQEVIQSSADRLTKLSAKWEEVRAPLLLQYRDLKAENATRESQYTQLLEEMRIMRERMKEVADETRVKDDLYKQLVSVGGWYVAGDMTCIPTASVRHASHYSVVQRHHP